MIQSNIASIKNEMRVNLQTMLSQLTLKQAISNKNMICEDTTEYSAAFISQPRDN